jgi:8-amino-7-oxononanoate synthase
MPRASAAGPVITIKGRRYINFSSNDYLGLANHPDIVGAARSALDEFGFGSGASRLLAGGTVVHERLEKLIAGFKQTDAARIFNSGHAANTGLIPALTTEQDIIFSDELNHASIIDGCRLSKAKTVTYRHKDISHLDELLKKQKGRRKMIVTDTVFSMDGDIAPIKKLFDLCRSVNSSPASRHSLLLYLDDAHGTGVLGKGRGALAHFDVRPEPWVVQMGTFSKACGSFGAYCAGAADVIEWISSTARSLLFSTALPASAAAASIAAIRIIRDNPELIRKLWLNREILITGLEGLGYDCMGSVTPIIPIRAGSVREAVRFSAYLYERGIYAPAIRPPTVKEPRIRITVSAAHEDRHMERLLDVLRSWQKKRKD